MAAGVSFNPETPVENLVQKHFPGENLQEFDRYMTQINTAEKTGKLGTDPQEKMQAIQSLLRQRYPQFMQDVNGQLPDQAGRVSGYDMVTQGEFPQYLANRGIMEQPQTTAQKYVYP